jgi:hypothetical protein
MLARVGSVALAIVVVVGVVVGIGAGAPVGSASAATTTTSQSSGSSGSSGSSSSGTSKPLSLPKTSYAQDTKYFTEVAQADAALVTYQQKQGNVALRALLTDGSAFCALLKRSRQIDEALVAEADGVRSTEAQTKLPLSVTTFNTIEAVALLTLCPSEQKLVPASVRSRIRKLGKSLATRPG